MHIGENIYADFVKGRLDSLYHENYSSMKAFAAHCLTDHYALMAEDCVQDSILKAYRNRETFSSASQLKSFLYACIHNQCIDILRKAKSQESYLSHQGLLNDDLAANIAQQETLDLLYEAIEELPEKYRQVFELSYEQALSNAEIAKLLGITISGVSKRKERMVAMLRKKFIGNDEMQRLLTILFLT
ncbi:MAG: RNA polymerase sigma factor [Prevotella sp.]|nr:RNA polymerase sigma factor [Prevotella sp.]